MKLFLMLVVFFFGFNQVFCQIPTNNQKGFKAPKQHKVVRGDTLWHLAEKYYSNPFMWGKIYNANLNIITNPDLIYPSDELVIPGITEVIKPSEPVKKEIPQEINVELTSEKASETTEPPTETVIETAKTKATAGFREDENLPELSESMPDDQKEWYSMLDTSVVPLNWKEDGVITGINDDNEFNEISFTGQVVELKLTGNIKASIGDIFGVYKKGATVYNKQGKTIGKEIQKTAMVEVIKIDKNTVIAKIMSANTAVLEGYVVKKK